MSISIGTPAGEGLAGFLADLEARCGAWTKPIAFLGVIGMLAVSGVTMLDVIMRWLFNSGITALNEIISAVFAITITACLPHGVAQSINLKLDLLENWIVGRLAMWVQAVSMALVLLLLCTLTWRMNIYAGNLSATGRTTVLQGAIHLVIFAVFILVSLVP